MSKIISFIAASAVVGVEASARIHPLLKYLKLDSTDTTPLQNLRKSEFASGDFTYNFMNENVRHGCLTHKTVYTLEVQYKGVSIAQRWPVGEKK